MDLIRTINKSGLCPNDIAVLSYLATHYGVTEGLDFGAIINIDSRSFVQSIEKVQQLGFMAPENGFWIPTNKFYEALGNRNDFPEIWNRFPNGNKEKAKKAYHVIIGGGYSHDELLSSLEKWLEKEFLTKGNLNDPENRKYLIHLSTFLEGRYFDNGEIWQPEQSPRKGPTGGKRIRRE